MPQTTTALLQGARIRKAEFPLTVTWNSNNYTAIGISPAQGASVEIAGEWDTYATQIEILEEDFPNTLRPESGELVTIGENDYEIAKVQTISGVTTTVWLSDTKYPQTP